MPKKPPASGRSTKAQAAPARKVGTVGRGDRPSTVPVAGKVKLAKPVLHSSGPRAVAKVPASSLASEAALTRRLKEFCRSLPGTTEDIKWVEHLCFSVGGKMFAIFDVADNGRIAFKADEIEFERLTKKAGIIPAPYAARFSWVKIVEHGAMTEKQIQACLRRSRELIIEKLPARKQAAVVAMEAGAE